MLTSPRLELLHINVCVCVCVCVCVRGEGWERGGFIDCFHVVRPSVRYVLVSERGVGDIY